MSYGIRILDREDHFVTVELRDILPEVQNGDKFFWSILYLVDPE